MVLIQDGGWIVSKEQNTSSGTACAIQSRVFLAQTNVLITKGMVNNHDFDTYKSVEMFLTRLHQVSVCKDSGNLSQKNPVMKWFEYAYEGWEVIWLIAVRDA